MRKVKIWKIIILISGATFLLSGCTDRRTNLASSESKVVFNDPQWKENQAQVYDLVMGDQNTGTSSFEIRQGELNGQKTYTIITKTILMGLIDTSSVTIWAKDLKPISTEKLIVVQQKKSEVKAEYTDNSVNLSLKVEPNSQNMKLSLPPDTYDNDSVLMILQAITFKEGDKVKFSNFSPVVGRTFLCELTVLGKEEVNVTAGTFECFKVEMKAAGETHYSWYAITEPHHLVMYDNGGLKFKLNQIL